MAITSVWSTLRREYAARERRVYNRAAIKPTCGPLIVSRVMARRFVKFRPANTVMEPDFHQHLAESTVSTTRILLEQRTRDAEIRMPEEDLPRAAQLIRKTDPDVVVFDCTSAGLPRRGRAASAARKIYRGSK